MYSYFLLWLLLKMHFTVFLIFHFLAFIDLHFMAFIHVLLCSIYWCYISCFLFIYKKSGLPRLPVMTNHYHHHCFFHCMVHSLIFDMFSDVVYLLFLCCFIICQHLWWMPRKWNMVPKISHECDMIFINSC